jgi:hypothetical protein
MDSSRATAFQDQPNLAKVSKHKARPQIKARHSRAELAYREVSVPFSVQLLKAVQTGRLPKVVELEEFLAIVVGI